MTQDVVNENSKAVVDDAELNDVQKKLDNVTIGNNNNNGNSSTAAAKSIRCVGRCNIELGDVSRHNLMVTR